jgi:glyoxylate/hydroxypyruvate reductase
LLFIRISDLNYKVKKVMTSQPIISFCCPTIDPQPWVSALAAALPQARILTWPDASEAADYAITWSPTQAFFDAQPKLKAVFALGAGVDALLRLRISPEIALVRIEDGGMGQQMADYVTHALLRHFRQFDRYAQDIREGLWSQYPAVDFADITVGVMGLGQLGAQIAQRVKSLGFGVLGYSRSPKAIEGIRCFSGDEMNAFLQPCHALVCAVPLTPQTQGILNAQTLGRLQRGAYLINVARGAHLVEEDLLDLLSSGQLSGACLDVLRQEPAPPNHPLRTHPRVMLTPHIAALTLLKPSIAQISQKILSFHSGQPVSGVVQRERGY